MKKALTIVFIVTFALALLGVTGVFLFRRFVTDQITDRGGMENPDAESEEQPLDGATNELRQSNEFIIDF